MNHVAQEFALMIENPYTGLVLMRAAHLNLRHVAQECHFLSHSALGEREIFISRTGSPYAMCDTT